MTLKEFALKALLEGSDYFGEKIQDEQPVPLEYDPTFNMYHQTILLMEENNHSSTSGIGFYPNHGELTVCSGHVLPWTIKITPEIQDELDKASYNKLKKN